MEQVIADEFVKMVNEYIDIINKSPDIRRISGMTRVVYYNSKKSILEMMDKNLIDTILVNGGKLCKKNGDLIFHREKDEKDEKESLEKKKRRRKKTLEKRMRKIEAELQEINNFLLN